jgi:glucose/mannose-6-phosphate isomerase
MSNRNDGVRTMRGWVLGLSEQLADALDACAARGWPPPAGPRTGDSSSEPRIGAGPPADASAPRAVLVCGMGGSAMAGDAARSILRDRLGVPIEVVRDPALPAWVGPGTLVLAVSYSGNTWETLRAARSAGRCGARVLAVTSGGALADEAREAGWALFDLPAGYSPRAALGWMVVPVALGALSGDACPYIADEVRSDLAEAAGLLLEEVAIWRAGGACPGRDPAEIAAAVEGRFAFIYAPEERLLPAAARWRGQLQENAKQAACAAAFPELAHNEIIGWRFAVEQLPAVFVLLEDERAAEGMRGTYAGAAVSELIASGARVVRIPPYKRPRDGPPTAEPVSGGAAARLFGHFLLADAVSVEVARRRGVDPLPVEAIERVKRAAAG